MKVIHLDGDGFFAEGVKRIFAAHGAELVSMTDARNLMEEVVDHSPDAVLLELRLSSLNGFEVLAVLRADPRTRHIPLMVWSKLASREDIQRCLDLGACEFFLKGQHHPREVVLCIKRRLVPEKGL